MLPSNRSYAFWLALFRIYVGVFWIYHALPKFLNADRFLPPNGFMVMMITTAINGAPAPANMPGVMARPPVGGLYHDFLAGVVLPHIDVFAEMVRVGELLVGIALVLGLLTRIGGLGGMFLAANYMLAQSTFFSSAGWSSLDGVTFVISAVNFVLPTGRFFGIDAFFSRPKIVRATASVQPVATQPAVIQSVVPTVVTPATPVTPPTTVAEKPEDAGGP
jgi:uncharacterized membrane protein YphA (DoxX/SURF4 family)